MDAVVPSIVAASLALTLIDRSMSSRLCSLGDNSSKSPIDAIAIRARYLLRLDDAPRYRFSLKDAEVSTARIAQHWFERWARTRFGQSETRQKLSMHTLVRPIRHGARVVLPNDEGDQISFRME